MQFWFVPSQKLEIGQHVRIDGTYYAMSVLAVDHSGGEPYRRDGPCNDKGDESVQEISHARDTEDMVEKCYKG